MGAGKSTVGEELAEKLGRPFLDVDSEIEREEPIARIFETGGEAAFRLRESKHAARRAAGRAHQLSSRWAAAPSGPTRSGRRCESAP